MVSLPTKVMKPTMYFIGVSTLNSSINDLFPRWTEIMGIEAQLVGIDLDMHANPEDYRKVVSFIKSNELSYGALVTTHKIDLLMACEELFDFLDPHALIQGELSCISKRNGKLEGYAKDPISSGLAMEDFVPDDFWKNHHGEVFIIGAGGSARAICSYLLAEERGDNIPSRIVISNRSKPRLEKIEGINERLNNGNVKLEYYLTPKLEDNDKIMETIKPNSLIVNATGLGKDRPGSPLSDDCKFPNDSLVWELNYRGDLKFYHQALAQKTVKSLYVEDGWMYFIYGWTEVIKEVFNVEINESTFKNIKRIALNYRN